MTTRSLLASSGAPQLPFAQFSVECQKQLPALSLRRVLKVLVLATAGLAVSVGGASLYLAHTNWSPQNGAAGGESGEGGQGHAAAMLRSLSPRGCEQFPIMEPEMTERETKLFLKIVQQPENLERYYVEFGSGGTTSIAPLWFKKSFSVESSPRWCEMISKQERVKCLIGSHRLQYICESPAVHKSRLTQTELMNRLDLSHYSRYYKALDVVVAAEEQRALTATGRKSSVIFGTVFLDGRFRVLCALSLWQYMDSESRLLIHDFRDRPTYQVLLRFFVEEVHEEEAAEQLVVLKKRPARAGDAEAREAILERFSDFLD